MATKKKYLIIVIAMVIMVSMVSAVFARGAAEAEKVTEIRLLNLKIEITEQFEMLADVYQQEFPTKRIVVESVGGGADYFASLRTMLAGGNMPDIFQNTGYATRDQWKEHLVDLSDQPFTQYIVPGTEGPISADGVLYGMPQLIEGYGILYNKDLFAKAGITAVPQTIGELQDVCERLQSVGIRPFSSAYREFWYLGGNVLNIGLGAIDNLDQFIADAKQGKADFNIPAFHQLLDFIDLTMQYGEPNPVATEYGQQIADFSGGRVAMILQGNWVQPTLDNVAPDMQVGVFPVPISSQPATKIYAATANNLAVYNKSTVKDEAIAFLNWMVTSPVAQRIITSEMKIIPPFNNFVYDREDLGAIGAIMSEYVEQGNIIGWYWEQLGPGSRQMASEVLQGYIIGQANREQTLQKLKEGIIEINR